MIQLSGTGKTLKELADEHLKNLTNGRFGFLSPKERLEAWISSGDVPNGQRRLVRNVYRNFEDIITSPVSKLRKYIRQLGAVNNTGFSQKFQDVLRYNAFRKSSRARGFIKNFELKSCPYCNAQYIITLDKSGKLLCHFDHVFPKDKYPYLSISFYNLIPCCSSCNQFKSDTDPLTHSSYHHPLELSLASSFRFKATVEAIAAFSKNGRTENGRKNIELIAENGKDIKFHLDTFRLEELYNEHNDVVDEVYQKSLIYNQSYIDELKRLWVDKGHLTEDELKRVMYGTYLDPHHINKRPLTKLNQDLLVQFYELQRR